MFRFLKFVAFLAAAAVLLAAVLYLFFGLRAEFAGSGIPRLTFLAPDAGQAEEIARHRAAQRAAMTESRPTLPGDLPAAPASDAPAPVSPATAPDAAGKPLAVGWTDFRGPDRDGRYRQQPVLQQWPADGPRLMWKQPVGGGYASFVEQGARVFTIEQRGSEEVAAAYDLKSGRELWTNSWAALFQESMGGDGPRATPTAHGAMVFFLGAHGELRCLEASTGRLIWRVNILEDNGAQNLQWGMAAAPLVVGDRVVVVPGGPNGRSVVAYDVTSGKRAWASLDDQAAYSSPMLVTLAEREQILVLTATRLVALAPDGGEVLWSYPWADATQGINVAQPLLLGNDRVFISAGYGVGAAVVEVTADDGRLSPREIWRNNRMKNKFTSSVLHDGTIYGLDEAILAAVDAATGELRWKGGRYGYGQLVLAGNRLIVLAEDGDLVLVNATPERHEELARFAAISGKTWNHPAIAHGILLVRNLREMAAFDIALPR